MDNLSGHLQFNPVPVADGSTLPSIRSSPVTQPSRYYEYPSETRIVTNTEETDAHLPLTKTVHSVHLENEQLAIFAMSLKLPALDRHPAVRCVGIRSVVQFPERQDLCTSTLGVHRVPTRSKKRHHAIVSIKPVMDVALVDGGYISSVSPYAVESSQSDGRANRNDDYAKHMAEAFG